MAYTVIGVLLLLAILADALITILSLRGYGPITGSFSRLVWSVLLRIHRKREIHSTLEIAGPSLMVFTVIAWYGMLFCAWVLIFYGQTYSVMASDTQVHASLADKVYFIGVTLSGLGYGDFVPTSSPWTAAATMSAFTGTVVTSLALSYVIGVIPVAIEKRQIAHNLNSFERALDKVLSEVGDSSDLESEKIINDLLERLNQAESFSQKFAAYPVVGYFHSRRPLKSYHCAVLQVFNCLATLLAKNNDSTSMQLARARFVQLVEMHLENLSTSVPAIKRCIKHRKSAHEVTLQGHDTDPLKNFDQYCSSQHTLLKAACAYDGWSKI